MTDNTNIQVFYRKCAVRGCTKPCKKEYMIGSMFGREYFCKEHYDEILATFNKKGDR